MPPLAPQRGWAWFALALAPLPCYLYALLGGLERAESTGLRPNFGWGSDHLLRAWLFWGLPLLLTAALINWRRWPKLPLVNAPLPLWLGVPAAVLCLLGAIAGAYPAYILARFGGRVWGSLAGPLLDAFHDSTSGHVVFGIVFYWAVFAVPILAALGGVCGDGLAALQPGRGAFRRDAVQSFMLAIAAGSLSYAGRLVLWYAGLDHQSAEITRMAGRVSGSAPGLAYMVAYSWLAGALFEELLRTFTLTRLRLVLPGAQWLTLRVLLSAALFGAAHSYQGLSGVVSASISGLVFAAYFERYGRFWPMVAAHGMYDTLCMLIWMVN
jgi:membrane protease YdiL (CAAX protease family)